MPSWNKKFAKESEQQEKMLGKEQAFTERMWNQTNDWNLAQWNRENAYNSPESQMERFALAGINPNNAAAAIAGNDSAAGSAQASNPSSPSAPSAPDPSGTDFAADLSAGVGLADQIIGIGKYIDTERDNQQAKYEQTMAQVRNLNADTSNKYYQGDELKEKIAGLKFDNTFMKPKELEKLNADTQKVLADKKVSDAQYDKIQQEKDNLEKEYEVLGKTIEEANQRMKESQARIAEIKEAMKTMQSQQDLNAANAELARHQKILVDAQKAKTDAEKKEQDLRNDWIKRLTTIGLDPDDHSMFSQLFKIVGLNINENLNPNKLISAVKSNMSKIFASGDKKLIDLANIIANGSKSAVKSYVRYASNNATNPAMLRGH